MSRKRRERGENLGNDLMSELGNNDADANANPFDGLAFGTPPTASDIADAGYGSTIGADAFKKLDSNREKIIKTPIESIVPNAMQPRRAIPAVVRHHWSGLSDAESIGAFFELWLDEIKSERQELFKDATPFPLTAHLESLSTARGQQLQQENDLEQISPSKAMGPKEGALMPIVELAASIKRDGLINPISIAQKDLLWEIETGERRWLAYQLLNWREGAGNDEWERIPARRVSDGISIWRQATENNTRSDLNAIASARQFALLLMALRVEEKGDQFNGFDAFEHEQGFYAQVKDGNAHGVPYGKGEMLINAMGISDVGQLRHLRRLLRLPQIVWTLADDLNWSENFLQKNIISTDETETIRNGVKAALNAGYPPDRLDQYAELLKTPESAPSKPKKLRFTDIQQTTLTKLEKQLGKLGKKDRDAAIDYLEGLLDDLKGA
ncbi:MAG: ParB N-terminal domain-containing protein [Chloroflexota bacterium]